MSFEDTLPKEINGRKIEALDNVYCDRWFAIYFRDGWDDGNQSDYTYGRIYADLGNSTCDKRVITTHRESLNGDLNWNSHKPDSEIWKLAESVIADDAPIQPLIDWVLENQVLCFGKEII